MTYQSRTTSDKLIEKISSLTHLLEIYISKTNSFSTKQKALQDMKTEMDLLFNVIQDSVKLNTHDLSNAFETKLKYHALSQSPQRLDIALTYLYTGMRHIDRSTGMGLFNRNHEVFATALLSKHSATISQIINS